MKRLLLVFLLLVSNVSATIAEDVDVNPRDWTVKMTGPGSGVQAAEEGVIALLYRAHAFGPTPWVQGSSLAFEWQPPESVKADDGRTYGDHLCVRIRTTGSIRKERSHEALDGIVVRIDSVTGDVYVQTTKDGITFENLSNGFKKGAGPVVGWHAVKVTDSDGKISVSLDGNVVVTADLPRDPPTGKMWGVYNREPVGPGKKVSLLRKVVSTTPPQ